MLSALRRHFYEPRARGPARLTEALERLVQLYDAWEKPDQAAEWRAKLPDAAKAEEKQEVKKER